VRRILNLTGIGGLVLIFLGLFFYLMKGALTAYAPYVVMVGLGCLLAYLVGNFQQLRKFFAKRSTKLGVNTFLMILLMVAIISLVEIISYRNNKRWDLTANKRYTLSDQTKKILNNLKQDVQVIAFYRPAEPGREKMEDLLSQYANLTNHFKYEFIDPDRNPVKAQHYKITSYGTTVIEANGREEKIYSNEEEDLTNAILKVTREKKKVIYFLTGHGEPGINSQGKDGYSRVRKAIEEQNYEVKELLLLRQEKVPDDAAVLIINGPKKDLMQEELKCIEDYIKRGGSLLCLLDPFTAPNLVALLDKYGIIVGKDVIIDRMSRIFGADYTMPVISDYPSHEITKDFNIASFFPVACSVIPKPKTDQGIKVQSLARTSRDSWAETNRKLLDQGKAAFDEGQDLRGPVSVAVVATIEQNSTKEGEKGKPNKARLVVYGDSDFVKNAYLHISGNKDLFLNTVSWLAEEEDLISIRPKTPQSVPVFLTASQARLIFWFPVIFLPAMVLTVGLGIVYRRRRLAQ